MRIKNVLLPLCTILLFSVAANAKIRRVGFFANQIASQDYFTFAEANAAAAAGDTILVFPGRTIPGNTVINKKLVIIGTGSWLDPNSTPKGNANLQAFAGTTGAGSVVFQSTAAGSTIMGFDFGNSTLYVAADNIVIRRNKDLYVNLSYNTNGSGSTAITVNNLQILENFRLGITDSYSGFTNSGLNISNNLMISFNLTSNSTFNGNIANNIWAYDNSGVAINGGSSLMSNNQGINLAGGAWLFQNNIIVSNTDASPASNYNYFVISGESNTVFNYNIALQSYNVTNWGTGTGNLFIPLSNVASIFQAFPQIGSSTADTRYQLAANSPAKQTNRPGSTVDAGIFGGLSPYKLSTIPSIPTIYSFSSPQGNNPAGNTILFNVSTRSNN